MPEEPPRRSGAGADPDSFRPEDDDPAGTRRDYWLVVLPMLASFSVTAYLLISVVFTDAGGVSVGVLLTQFLFGAWQLRPGGPADRRPPGCFRSALLCVVAVVAVDTLVLVVGLTTDRLPSWGPGAALVLLLAHLGFLVVVAVRRHRYEGDDAREAPAPVEPAVPWRHQPEPLRTAGLLVAVGTALALGSFVVSELVGASTESAAVLWAGTVWGASWVVFGLCVAFDVRGSAGLLAHRSQVQREHRGLLAAQERLPRLRWLMRGSGLMGLAVGGLITTLFWPWQ